MQILEMSIYITQILPQFSRWNCNVLVTTPRIHLEEIYTAISKSHKRYLDPAMYLVSMSMMNVELAESGAGRTLHPRT